MSTVHDPESTFARQLSCEFIDALSHEDSPFQRPDLFNTLPYLLDTGRRFSASNLLHLMLMRQDNGELWIRAHPAWVSEKHIRQLGLDGHAESKTRLLRWGKKDNEHEGLQTRVFNGQSYTLQAFSVVNASTLHGLELPPNSHSYKQPSEVIDDFVKAVDLKFTTGSLIESKFAFYNSQKNEGVLPELGTGNPPLSQEELDAIKLHLVLHALSQQSGKNKRHAHGFPTAKEELTLMLATLLIASDAGMKTDAIFKHHADYTNEWMRIAREEPLGILQSCREAEELVKKMRSLQSERKENQAKGSEEITMSSQALIALKKAGWTGEMVVKAERIDGRNKSECSDSEAQYFAVYGKTIKNELLFVAKTTTRKDAEKFAYRFGVLSGLKRIHSQTDSHSFANQKNDDKTQTVPKRKQMPKEVVYLQGAYTRDPEQFKANKARIYALDGGYDGKAKCWYVPKGVDLASVQDLIHKHVIDPTVEFKQALLESGFVLGEQDPICDGKIHRCRLSDDKGHALSGAYVMHNDAWPAGYIQNFRTGEVKRWKASNVGQHLTGEQLLIAKAKAEAVSREREAERNEIQKEAAIHSRQFLQACQKTTQPTEYLKRKGFAEADLKLLGGILIDARHNVVVPLRDIEGQIWSHQTICDNGMKMLAKGGRKQGNFSVIGTTSLEQSKHVLICEGCATAMSVALAMPDTAVLMAIDAGNLPEVAQAIHHNYPKKAILICGDDDRTNQINKGREKALEAAKLVGGQAVFPIFPPDKTGKAYTDFNDLAQCGTFGRQSVEIQIQKALDALKVVQASQPRPEEVLTRVNARWQI